MGKAADARESRWLAPGGLVDNVADGRCLAEVPLLKDVVEGGPGVRHPFVAIVVPADIPGARKDAVKTSAVLRRAESLQPVPARAPAFPSQPSQPSARTRVW